MEQAVLYTAIFGLLGIFLSVLGFKVFDWATPKLHFAEELAHKQNVAVAIVCASIILGICLIISRAIG
jgi:putative membrane protein